MGSMGGVIWLIKRGWNASNVLKLPGQVGASAEGGILLG